MMWHPFYWIFDPFQTRENPDSLYSYSVGGYWCGIASQVFTALALFNLY